MRGLCLTLCMGWLAGEAIGCPSNNCLRALSNNRGDRNATADCIEFLKSTVTPATSTFTATVSVVSSVATLTLRTTTHDSKVRLLRDRDDELHGRNAVTAEKAMPSYATSACLSLSAFSSACSCLGASEVIATAEADSTTVTHTLTRTVARTTVRPSLGNSTVSLNSTSGRWHNTTLTKISSRSTSSHQITGLSSSVTLAHSSNYVVLAPTDLGTKTMSKTTSEVTSAEMASINGTMKTHYVNSSTTMTAASGHGTAKLPGALSTPAWNSTTLTTSSGHGSAKLLGAVSTSPWNSTTLITSSVHGSGKLPGVALTASPWNSTALATSYTTGSSKALLVNLSASGLASFKSASSSVSHPLSTVVNKPLINGTSDVRPLNSSVAFPTSIGSVTAIHWVNTTTIVSSLSYYRTLVSATGGSVLRLNTTGRWGNSSTPTVTTKLNITSSLRLNTSVPTAAPNITTGRWLNTTRLSANGTTVRWGNSTLRANTTTPLWRNVSAKATPTPTVDLTCGETTAPFALQVSQAGGMFDNWFVHVVGDGLLFTSVASSASAFSVEQTGHLCAVGHLTADGKPYLASIGSLDDSSAVWMLDQNILKHQSDDYGALNCTAGGTLSCAGNATAHWIGCGLQLDLSRSADANVPYDGLNCTSLGLNVVPLGSGAIGSGNGTANGLYRNGTMARRAGYARGQRAYDAGKAYVHTTS